MVQLSQSYMITGKTAAVTIQTFAGKAMPNLDSVMKGKDITLLTKVHILKAMVFSVVMYSCEIWMVKKAECQRIDASEL